jgi:lipopolysaccharide transport system ATP-binding protein
MRTAIAVEDVSKYYRLGVIGSGTLADDLKRGWARMQGKSDPTLKIGEKDFGNREDEFIWALRNVSFRVEQGEVLGIIGRNGAGKSTLLKILSRVTAPTSGQVNVRGRIASLLEVGTGFHPELTGRENIYLNGAILGMRRAEIDRKLDEIVDFSGVEQFIDTPVKRYSSGMSVRLAFAVAAHLEPEILVVDEVLAVGDAEFQQKCLGKMSGIASEGRTVLFVSHNMQAVRQLCQRGIVLKDGKIIDDEPVNEAVANYLLGTPTASSTHDLKDIIRDLPADPAFRLQSITLSQQGHPVVDHVLNGSPLEIEFTYDVLEATRGLRVFFDLCDTEGILLIRSFHDEQNEGIVLTEPGHYVAKATIPANILAPISYDIYFQAGIYNVRLCMPNGIRLRLSVQRTGDKNRAYLADRNHGKIAPVFPWITSKIQGDTYGK